MLADRAYDTNPVRQLIEGQGAAPNISSKMTRRWKSCFSPVPYKARNAIERMFCRLKELASPPFGSAASQPAPTSSPPTS